MTWAVGKVLLNLK